MAGRFATSFAQSVNAGLVLTLLRWMRLSACGTHASAQAQKAYYLMLTRLKGRQRPRGTSWSEKVCAPRGAGLIRFENMTSSFPFRYGLSHL